MSHAYDTWADGNLDPQPAHFDQVPTAERDTCINTLKDVVRLADENMPATEALFRIRKIALATLTTFGEADGLDGSEQDEAEPASGWFSDDDVPDRAA
jgi:hypothetical protein